MFRGIKEQDVGVAKGLILEKVRNELNELEMASEGNMQISNNSLEEDSPIFINVL